MSMTRWDPLREMVSLRDAMDRLFEESLVRPRDWLVTRQHGLGTLALDMYEKDHSLIVEASVPGFQPDEIKVAVKDNQLTISGETKKEEERKEEHYHLHERRYGNFERNVMLPYAVETEQAEATFENGVLTLTLPKAQEVGVKQIPVKAKEPVPA